MKKLITFLTAFMLTVGLALAEEATFVKVASLGDATCDFSSYAPQATDEMKQELNLSSRTGL